MAALSLTTMLPLLFVLIQNSSGASVAGTIQEAVWCDSALFFRTDRNVVYRSVAGADPVTYADGVRDIVQAPYGTLLLLGAVGGLSFTEGCGNTTNRHELGFEISHLRPHPSDKGRLLASSTRTCIPGSECFIGMQDLRLSEDSGKTWRVIAENVLHFEWWCDSENQGILATVVETSVPYLVYTDDFFSSHRKLLPRCEYFHVAPHEIFAVDSNHLAYLLRLDQTAIRKARFSPAVPASWGDFELLEASQNAAFVFVARDRLATIGDLYVLAAGDTFRLSLRGCTRPHGEVSFVPIAGVMGCYLANCKTNDDSREGRERTVRTDDYGATWEPLKAPKACPKCSLQIFLRHSTVPSPYSAESYHTGVIMANGNVGTALTRKMEKVSTFASRDAGRTWTEIFKKPGAFGTFGDVLVAAMEDIVYYSWGQDWLRLFGRSKSQTEGIAPMRVVVSPDRKNLAVISSGSIVSYPNLSAKRVCTDSDFELWTPPCARGRKITYRRLVGNGTLCSSQSPPPAETIPCECDEQTDYDCDTCYHREDGRCVKDQLLTPECEGKALGCETGKVDYYERSSGYRKMRGDICVGGTVHRDPVLIPCHDAFEDGVSLETLCALGFACVLLTGGYLLYLRMKRAGRRPRREEGDIEFRTISAAGRGRREEDGDDSD